MAAESSVAASGSRSGGGGPSVDSYIGSLISLTSKSEIRYEGILYNINTEESSIGLRNVRSFGTEGRKKDGPQVPPSDKIYEYILFRGTDIKDLQVKASPPVQTTPPINSDPAIIQSHYPRPTTPPTSFPTAPIGSLPDLGSHSSSQMGLPGSAFPSGLPLYQPGGNLNAWGPSPPNANGSGLPMPMYWQGYYGAPNGLPQLPQQSMLRPPAGLPPAPSMQQMQFSSFNPSMPMAPPNLPSSSLPDYHSSLVPNSTSSSSLTPSTSLPASTLSMSVPPLQPASLTSETTNNLLSNKAPLSSIPASTHSSVFPSMATFSVSDHAGISSLANKTIAAPAPSALPQQNASQPLTSVSGTSGSGLIASPAPSLITPGQLLQSGPSPASAPQTLQTIPKDVEVAEVPPNQFPEPSAPIVTEAQPPILPLPPNARAHKPNGGAYHMRGNYRGRGGGGGRGPGASHPVTKFTEEFDFTAMNEKFKKDEVWGHLGKSNRKDNDGNGSGSDEEEPFDEHDVELPTGIKPLYNKDDFFDSISSNDANRGRTRYSEQMKLDTETFGEFSRYRGGRGGRGQNRGRFRGSSYGRGYNGYGYVSRGRGRGVQNRDS